MNVYDFERSEINENEKKRIKFLLESETPADVDGFERHFLRYFRENGKHPTTNLGKAWVSFGINLGYDTHGFTPNGTHYKTKKLIDTEGFDVHGYRPGPNGGYVKRNGTVINIGRDLSNEKGNGRNRTIRNTITAVYSNTSGQ